MEVEVKLRVHDAANHSRLKDILSPFHIETLNQQNFFFDSSTAALSSQRAVLRIRFFNNDTRCVLSLKARPVLIAGVSRVEEDEEEIDPVMGRECAADAYKLGSMDSKIVRRCKEEFEVVGEMGFVCLGGFENVRGVYEWTVFKVEVDETKNSFGVCYELECESDDPERVQKELERSLKENGIEYKYSEISKFATFRSEKLP